ncbi:hypothetical protein WA026_021110 [Henosepilachna vigintioctopunctata]|uniref:Cytochrome P450 n=1 Tax=Henosepilachna vigintioctopunctata TaxID=420089 RepID=A0AAW1V2C9_9CUCU
MSEISMGIKQNDQSEAQRFGLWLEELLPILLIRMTNVFYRMDIVFRWTKYKKIQDELLCNINEYLMNRIEKRRAKSMSGSQHIRKYHINEASDGMLRIECFLDMLLYLSDNKKKFSLNQIKDEISTFLGGSTETTATTMSFCCLLLGMHPIIQQQVHEEIIKTVGEDGKVTSEVLPHLKYLEYCLQETMRIFPLTPLLLRIATADIELEPLTFRSNVLGPWQGGTQGVYSTETSTTIDD